MRALNAFTPYKRQGPEHENNLSRAFLLVLRGVPVAHAAWLDLVDRGHRANQGEGVPKLHELVTPRVYTQIGKLPEPVSRVISVLQTDEHYFAKADLTPASRTQVLDGVVSYAPHLAIVVENKLHSGAVWDGQLSINLGESEGETVLDQRAACVPWHDVVSAWAQLLQSGHLGVAERWLVDDFLGYVEAYFDHLQPYSTVRQCGASKERLERRCRILLETLAPGSVGEHRGGWTACLVLEKGGPAVKIGLFPEEDGSALVIAIALGDTVGQARRLYGDHSFVDVEGLLAAGWETTTNFHCAFMQQNIFYPAPTKGPAKYWETWRTHPDWIRNWDRTEFDELFSHLNAEGIVATAERQDFDRLWGPNRKALNACPGLYVRYRIPLQVAQKLDDEGSLVGKVRTEIKRAAAAFGLPLPGLLVER